MAVLSPEVRRKACDATRVLDQLAAVQAAYVFGSQAEGRADEWSDIDVAAFMDGVETWGIEERANGMSRVWKEVGLDVEAHLFPSSALEHAEKGSFAEYILRHGVCVMRKSA